jgi:hypothetical protein
LLLTYAGPSRETDEINVSDGAVEEPTVLDR